MYFVFKNRHPKYHSLCNVFPFIIIIIILSFFSFFSSFFLVGEKEKREEFSATLLV